MSKMYPIMTQDFSFSVLTIYAGYPVTGFSVLAVDTPDETYALVHVEWTSHRLLISGLWLRGALLFNLSG